MQSASWCKHECNDGAVRYTLIRRVARIPSLLWPRRPTCFPLAPTFATLLLSSSSHTPLAQGNGTNAAKITHVGMSSRYGLKNACFPFAAGRNRWKSFEVWYMNNHFDQSFWSVFKKCYSCEYQSKGRLKRELPCCWFLESCVITQVHNQRTKFSLIDYNNETN